MRFREISRTTTFRLTALHGLVFALGTVALLGLVYYQSAVYLTRRVDRILSTEAAALAASPPGERAQRIDDALDVNADRTSVFGLFARNGAWIAGNLRSPPAGLAIDGPPIEIPPSADFRANARLIARRLPTGEELVVGRDVNQLQEMRAIIASALLWSGVAILLVGLASGTALSISPLRRLRELQAAGDAIAGGDLRRRMPTSSHHDELDMFAGTVNLMMDEVERLMAEVKAATDTIAHDLRTPLTHARAQLHRLEHAAVREPTDIARVTAEIDEVLERFRALLRISELEARQRAAGFSDTRLSGILERAVELYQPLAEAEEVSLALTVGAGVEGVAVEADSKLLFEAVSNLIDNAIKFTSKGGAVAVRLRASAGVPQIIVEDNGPGIPPGERAAVLHRFYRGSRDRLTPGSGLGLSIVAAIVKLHRFELILDDARPGLRAIIQCQAASIVRRQPSRPL